MYSASILKSSKQIMVIGSGGFRNYISCEGVPIFAVVQGDEVHATLENGWVSCYNLKTGQRLRTITG